MVLFQNVNKQFKRFKVLKSINLHLPKGKVVALIGPNACGKTTLIKTLLGMVIPDSGEIIFNGQPITEDWAYRRQIGYMPQIGRYPENMTVGQVLEMIESLRSGTKHETDRELLDAFHLSEILKKRMNTLSGGTRQKVSAYLAFLFDPKMLVLDEPTAGLDPVSSLILKNKILREKEKGKLILITSHILSELDDVVDQVVYMEDGKVIFHKPFEVLLEDTRRNKLTDAIAEIMNHNAKIQKDEKDNQVCLV